MSAPITYFLTGVGGGPDSPRSMRSPERSAFLASIERIPRLRSCKYRKLTSHAKLQSHHIKLQRNDRPMELSSADSGLLSANGGGGPSDERLSAVSDPSSRCTDPAESEHHEHRECGRQSGQEERFPELPRFDGEEDGERKRLGLAGNIARDHERRAEFTECPHEREEQAGGNARPGKRKHHSPEDTLFGVAVCAGQIDERLVHLLKCGARCQVH